MGTLRISVGLISGCSMVVLGLEISDCSMAVLGLEISRCSTVVLGSETSGCSMEGTSVVGFLTSGVSAGVSVPGLTSRCSTDGAPVFDGAEGAGRVGTSEVSIAVTPTSSPAGVGAAACGADVETTIS
ncbi:hypothetical protein HOY80DRAFT_996049 [Tuber brumale]|nr:hypothetical protein HOY80DRAFT_996049 [Tuber brumale]